MRRCLIALPLPGRARGLRGFYGRGRRRQVVGQYKYVHNYVLEWHAYRARPEYTGIFLGSSLRLLSWNIDGLDGRNLEERITAVYQTILLKQPDVVYLQEVIQPTLAILQKKLKSKYHCLAPASPPAHYFVAILVKQQPHSVPGSLSSETYPGTRMGRQLVQVPLSYHGVSLLLMTSHLESMKDYARERKTQLQTAFDIMVENQKDKVCIFGGDLNVREAEVKSVKVPKGVVDVWEACGADPNTRYTWDVKNNDNLDWSFPNRPQARYDRIYISPADGKLRPIRFELTGQDRLDDCGRFPSDHWGLWLEFDIKQ